MATSNTTPPEPATFVGVDGVPPEDFVRVVAAHLPALAEGQALARYCQTGGLGQPHHRIAHWRGGAAGVNSVFPFPRTT